MDSINFTANFVKTARINRLNKNNKYSPYEASIVELDYHNKNDVSALSETVSNWDDSLTVFSVSDMENAKNGKGIVDPFKVYAMTTQKSNFEEMNPDKILGVIEVSDKTATTGRSKIEILQTNPEYNYDVRYASKTKYKDIGKRLVKQVQSECSSLYAYPVKSAVRFYETMGFKKAEDFQKTNYMYFEG